MKRKTRFLTILLLVVALLAAMFIYININLRPVLFGLSSARVQSIAAKAMNDAILDILSGNGEL